MIRYTAQQAFTCLKSAIETLEKGVKRVNEVILVSLLFNSEHILSSTLNWQLLACNTYLKYTWESRLLFLFFPSSWSRRIIVALVDFSWCDFLIWISRVELAIRFQKWMLTSSGLKIEKIIPISKLLLYLS